MKKHEVITEFKTLDNFFIYAKFSTNEERIYNIAQLIIRFSEFQDLIDIVGLFDCATLEPGGYALSWNEYLDITSTEIYERGYPL